jgi:hypothetical protein
VSSSLNRWFIKDNEVKKKGEYKEHTTQNKKLTTMINATNTKTGRY